MNGLALAAILLGFQDYLRARRPPLDLSARDSRVEYEPIELRLAGAGPARIAGAWRLGVTDSRLGGVSGLAVDGGRLLALTDAGMVAWLDLPGTPRPRASLRALPAAAGHPATKIGRDSEALARDRHGRGWWVAFEQVHSLLLFDAEFTALVERRPLDLGDAPPNRGIEALFEGDGGGLVALRESSGMSDGVRLPDGRVALLERRFGLTGMRSQVRIGRMRIALPLGPAENPEAIATAPLAKGATRLWIMTDNDFRKWRPTLLVAIDLPPATPQPTSR